MNAPIFEQQFAVHVHTDEDIERRELIAHTAGPAGIASMELEDGLDISIDYTETGLVTQIDIESDSEATSLPTLIGDERAVDALNAQPRSEGQPVLLRAQSEYVGPGQSINPVNNRSRAFGNAVACVSTAQDQSEDRLVRAIAVFELAQRMTGLSTEAHNDSNMFTSFLETNLSDAAATVSSNYDKLLVRAVQSKVLDDLTELLSQVAESGTLSSEASKALRQAMSTSSPKPIEDITLRSGEHVHVKAPGRVEILSDQEQPSRSDTWFAYLADRESPDSPIASGHVERHFTGWSSNLVVPAALTADTSKLASLSINLSRTGETADSTFYSAVRLARIAVDSELEKKKEEAIFNWKEAEAAWRTLDESNRASRARAFRKGNIKVDRPRFLHRLLKIAR